MTGPVVDTNAHDGESVAASPAQSGRARNAAMDGLKYLAAASIVLHHVSAAEPGRLGWFLTAAPLWGLFFFFAVSGYFHGEVGGRGWRWVGKRAIRLGVPYAFWSLVYLEDAYLTARASASAYHLPTWWIAVFFSGAHGILWALPMLFYSAVFVELFARNVMLRRFWIVVGLGVTLVMYFRAPLGAIYASPLQHFILAPRWIAVYLLGMEVRALASIRKAPAWVWALAPLSMLAVGVLGVRTHDGWGGRFTVSLATALWLFGALVLVWVAGSGLSMPRIERFAWGRDYLLGIYVTHVLFLGVFATRVPPTSLPAILWIPAAWAFAFGLASTTTWVFKSVRPLRALVL